MHSACAGLHMAAFARWRAFAAASTMLDQSIGLQARMRE
ncbi:hypothetical protein JL2886_01419 [Phaeobacter gallaeciensis]|uniref:Uncharacterized protein n=1 Tax=Phaeobacter gallaeciensis TaxID=60890 RepID=A0A1B0ZQ91_9RHOB|nr:hypothetical protein JL2886_01419 [Phaeobacter gallaeciensis]